MIPVDQLKDENREIDDLRRVLAALVRDEKMHTNRSFCELLERFQARLNHHLKHEARALYPDLLRSRDSGANNVAKDFLENTRELERLMNKYVRHWCHKLEANELAAFIQETEEVFDLVADRIKLEEVHLFPAL
jgi:hemerythrin-like domain-containing protein